MPISTKGPAVLAVGVEVEGDIETGVDIAATSASPPCGCRTSPASILTPHEPTVTLQAHALADVTGQRVKPGGRVEGVQVSAGCRARPPDVEGDGVIQQRAAFE